MKNSKTRYEIIRDSVKRNYSYLTDQERERIALQELAHFITRGRTIGRNKDGKLVVGKK